MVASSLIKTCLPFIHQCIQRAPDLCEIPIRHPSMDLCGLWAYMPEQHLDISQVGPALKQVCRKGVPQRMYRYPLVNIGFFASPVKRFLYRPTGQMPSRPGAREQPCSGLILAPVVLNRLLCDRGEHRVTILPVLALADMEQFSIPVDVFDLESS